MYIVRGDKPWKKKNKKKESLKTLQNNNQVPTILTKMQILLILAKNF